MLEKPFGLRCLSGGIFRDQDHDEAIWNTICGSGYADARKFNSVCNSTTIIKEIKNLSSKMRLKVAGLLSLRELKVVEILIAFYKLTMI